MQSVVFSNIILTFVNRLHNLLFLSLQFRYPPVFSNL